MKKYGVRDERDHKMLTISKANARFEAIFNLVAQTFDHKPTTLQQYEQYKL